MSGAFDRLAPPVRKWVRGQGWRALRDIQVRAIHAIMDDERDVIISAGTAGGKTEAAFLPLISQVLSNPDAGGFDLLCISPLKALITDQARRLEDICRQAELPVVPWHGDVPASVKARALKSPRGILLITPESLEALFIRRGLEIPRLFGGTQAVIIDELHSVLDSERGVQMRSLLTRLELTINRPIRRIGLSATLGDLTMAQEYLRPDASDQVVVLEDDSDGAELRLQLRGYVAGQDDGPAAEAQVAAHLFRHLRGSDNLVFAGARQNVEAYADHLRNLCENAHLPQEFYPHHASLSRDHRNFVEQRLKRPDQPTTAICTSTLELGIDIGDVACVAQIGAPFSVASLRQRLGRSGRREGQPAILRQYAIEARLDRSSNFSDRLRLSLIRAIAMIELLLEGWCEPPRPQALHLSTLVHQILSVIAAQGGARADRIFRTLCQSGPFRQVTQPLFVQVLRAMGQPERPLIEQSPDGLLLLGALGEKLVEHYSFYAVFQTPEEYRLIANGKELGSLPVTNILTSGMFLIFSGRRWRVVEIHDADRAIIVTPAKAGKPPIFGGDPGDIDDRVIRRMFGILEGQGHPPYLDQTARDLLDEARRHFDLLGLRHRALLAQGERSFILATRSGTIKTATLALALQARGFAVQSYDGFLEVTGDDEAPPLINVLSELAQGAPVNLFSSQQPLQFEKFHPYLTPPLLQADALSSRLDIGALPGVCADILGQ